MVEKGNCTVLKVFPISNSGLETHSTMKFRKKEDSSPDLGWYQISKKDISTFIYGNSVDMDFNGF